MARPGKLSENIIDFCALLRNQFGFGVGHAEARDALRAAETVGIADPERTRTALRLTLCGRRDHLEPFDRAFHAFFLHPDRGVAQSAYAPRHSRPPANAPRPEATPRPVECKNSPGAPGADELARPHAGAKVFALDEQPLNPKEALTSSRARYSAQAHAADPPAIEAARIHERLEAASDLIASVRLGRVRRWKPRARGPRFDMRRTLRTSLHTGGDLVTLRFLGHPLRNPRFVVFIDGSRSMAPYGRLALEFAAALASRTRRASVFVFSTELREVTLKLRRSAQERQHSLNGVGEAWGGGTKIGASLMEFVHAHGGKRLSDETVVLIYSDGLDVGDPPRLARAMREIHRHSAAVIWINPLIGTLGYAPQTRGMRAALPHVDAFVGLREPADLAQLARHAAAVTR